MNSVITLKTRVSMSFKHPTGIAAIAQGTTVRVIKTRFGGYQHLIDYGNGIRKWETADVLTRLFEGFRDSGLADGTRCASS